LRLLFVLLALFLHLCTTAFAQPAKQYSFLHFTTANGLAANFVNSMAQDEEGFMWFGTINGLQRYDGYKFVTFRSVRGNTSSLPIDNVSVLFYDKKFNLWIITADNKVGIFNTRTFHYKKVPLEGKEKKVLNAASFTETADGKLLLHEFFSDTYQYDTLQQKFVVNNKVIPVPKGWRRGQVAWDPMIKKYWMSADSGLILYNPSTQKLSYRGHNVENDEVIQAFEKEVNVHNILVDAQQNISISTWPPLTAHPYLYNFNRKTKEIVKHNLSDQLNIAYHEISGFVQQRNGRIWVLGRPFLAEWLADKKTLVPVANEYNNEQSIRFDYVTSWYEDGERNIWVGTDNGLYLFNPGAQKFNNYNLVRPGQKKAKEGPVQAALQTKEGNILIGCWGIGLYNYDKDLNPIPLPKSLQTSQDDLSVWDMLQHTKTGKIWIALQYGGIIVYDPATGNAQKIYPDVFEKRTIRQVKEDKDGNLWFGTHAGKIIKWDFNKAAGNINEGYLPVYQTGLVHKIAADNRGTIWIATLANGLLKINPQSNTVVRTFTNSVPGDNALINSVPTDILQYNDSTLVVVSNGLNLINLNTDKVTHITTAEGLPSNTAFCVQKDAKGILWLGMINGLCRANLEKNIYGMYDRRDGIAYDNFSVAGAHRLNDGRLLYATDHNFLIFDPNQFVQPDNPPDPDITSFKLANRSLLTDSLVSAGGITLSHNNNSIAIEFSVLSFLKQNQPQYYYILEGFDKDWRRADDGNQAVYTYLPPGNYVFKVKSRNQDGIYSKGFATLAIEVNLPVWKTWWFYALVLLVIVSVLYIIDKERLKRLKAVQSMRSQIAINLHQEVNVTLNDINLLSEIAKIKADKDIDRSKDYIDQITVKSRGMIESMDDMLWSIEPENDSMEKILLRLKEFTAGFMKTHGADIDISVDKDIPNLLIDMRTRYEFMYFYKEALNYIIRHSVCSTIYISFEYIKSRLYLKILAQCNQVQYEDVSSLHAKKEMEKRADALNAALDIIADRKSISIILQIAI
jgi:ligand-binding sensor domain-containing protein